jgi:hypothetical protein
MAGASLSLTLCAAGVLMDLIGGKTFYEERPFLSSIPKETFKVVLLATIGVFSWKIGVRA